MSEQKQTNMRHTDCCLKTRPEKSSGKNKLFMGNSKILENDILLNFVSRDAVAWTLVKIFTAYKYVGFLI